MKRLMAIVSAYASPGDEEDLTRLFREGCRVILKPRNGDDPVILEAGRVDALEWAETIRAEVSS